MKKYTPLPGTGGISDLMKKGFTVKKSNAVVVFGRGKKALDIRFASRQVQAVGGMDFGDTLIWDRAPGDMHLGAVLAVDGIFTMMRKVVKVEAGSTYYVDFKIQNAPYPTVWELRKIE